MFYTEYTVSNNFVQATLVGSTKLHSWLLVLVACLRSQQTAGTLGILHAVGMKRPLPNLNIISLTNKKKGVSSRLAKI